MGSGGAGRHTQGRGFSHPAIEIEYPFEQLELGRRIAPAENHEVKSKRQAPIAGSPAAPAERPQPQLVVSATRVLRSARRGSEPFIANRHVASTAGTFCRFFVELQHLSDAGVAWNRSLTHLILPKVGRVWSPFNDTSLASISFREARRCDAHHTLGGFFAAMTMLEAAHEGTPQRRRNRATASDRSSLTLRFVGESEWQRLRNVGTRYIRRLDRDANRRERHALMPGRSLERRTWKLWLNLQRSL